MPEPYYDRKEQLDKIRATLIPGEDVAGVFDTVREGADFLGVTTKRVIFYGRLGVNSIPYRHIQRIEHSSWQNKLRCTTSSGSAFEFECLSADKAYHATQMILFYLLG